MRTLKSDAQTPQIRHSNKITSYSHGKIFHSSSYSCHTNEIIFNYMLQPSRLFCVVFTEDRNNSILK